MSTVFSDHLLTGDHASRPTANAVPQGTLYSCTEHGIIYKSDGVATWSDWATISGVVSAANAELEALIGAKAAASHRHLPTEAEIPGLTAFVQALITAGAIDLSSLEFLIGSKAHASHRHQATEANLPGITALIVSTSPPADTAMIEALLGTKASASHRHVANESNLPGITALIAASAGGAVDSDQNILANQIFGA